MNADLAKNLGNLAWNWVNSQIPQPDVTIFMGDKTTKEKGILIAKRVASIAIPLFADALFNTIGAGLTGFVSGMMGFGLGLCVSALNIGKAWVVNKVIDLMIKDTSKYFLLKDEIKKVTDASISVLIGVAYLVATIVLPYFGPLGIISSSINLALNIGTLARACYELHEKRKDPLVAAASMKN